MKKIILLALLIILNGCDIVGEFYYEIENNTQKDIQVRLTTIEYGETIVDSLIISPTQNLIIKKRSNGNSAASDIFRDSLSQLESLRVYYDGTLINKNFKHRSYWIYSDKDEYDGTYLLKVNDSI